MHSKNVVGLKVIETSRAKVIRYYYTPHYSRGSPGYGVIM